MERLYTSRRDSIVEALVSRLKEIDGTGDFLSNLYGNVSPVLKFWDEVNDFPSVHVTAGPESREYLGGGVKNRFLSLSIRCYVKEEMPVQALNRLLEDIETLIEQNSRLEYLDKQGRKQFTKQMSVITIQTDEGVFDPIGVGEIEIEVMY